MYAVVTTDTGRCHPHVPPPLLLPGGWKPTVVPGALGSGVCPSVVVLTVVAVLLVGWLVAGLVARGVALLARTPGTVGPATVLEEGLVAGGGPVVGGRGLSGGPEDMVSRIQPFSLVMRVYTPGLLA